MLNFTLIMVVIVMICMVMAGYKKGLTRQISGLVALIAAFVILSLGIMLVSSFQNREVTNTVYSVILLTLFGLVYGIVKFLLRSFKLLSNLPILSFLDHVLGIAVGLVKGILIVWIFFLLCEHNYLGELTEYVRADISKSTILKLLYQYNFFIN